MDSNPPTTTSGSTSTTPSTTTTDPLLATATSDPYAAATPAAATAGVGNTSGTWQTNVTFPSYTGGVIPSNTVEDNSGVLWGSNTAIAAEAATTANPPDPDAPLITAAQAIAGAPTNSGIPGLEYGVPYTPAQQVASIPVIYGSNPLYALDPPEIVSTPDPSAGTGDVIYSAPPTTNTTGSTTSDSTDPAATGTTGATTNTIADPTSTAGSTTSGSTDPAATAPTGATTATASGPASTTTATSPPAGSPAQLAQQAQTVASAIAAGENFNANASGDYTYNINVNSPTDAGNTAVPSAQGINALNAELNPATSAQVATDIGNAGLNEDGPYVVAYQTASGAITNVGGGGSPAVANDPYANGNYTSAEMEAMGYTLVESTVNLTGVPGATVTYAWVGPTALEFVDHDAAPGAGWQAVSQPYTNVADGSTTIGALQSGNTYETPTGGTATVTTGTTNGTPDVQITGTTSSGANYTSTVVEPAGTQLQVAQGMDGTTTETPTMAEFNAAGAANTQSSSSPPPPPVNMAAFDAAGAANTTSGNASGALKALKGTGSALLRPAFLKKSRYDVGQSADKLHTSHSGQPVGGGQAIPPASDPVMGATADKSGDKPTTSGIKH